ncbi:MAG: hypothetical protein LQ342_000377 [Letrouitia transgressa]|nr:MAG: hypothetical protein LQ342_000377 [Letrouitia transgressa]
MSSASVASPEYWGYLIKPDKSPSPVFEQLLLGIANYILAAFYRLVGGDYDLLFLETPRASLSFIYQSLGCYHTLQPEKDPYSPPSTPALTPHGFVRWQTVQLLLEPDEHVPFLQEAVKRFDIVNPVDGIGFPSLLPRDALPSSPDPDMVTWHERVADKLMLEAQGSQTRGIGDATFTEISDSTTTESSVTSSIDERSLVDTAGYSMDSRFRPSSRPHTANVTRPIIPQPYFTGDPPPWNPERRRSSLPDLKFQQSRARHQEDLTPTAAHSNHNALRRPVLRHRSPSTVSTSSTSDSSSSSLTASSASQSPTFHHPHHLHRPDRERRHPTYGPDTPREYSSSNPISHQPGTDYFPPQYNRPSGTNGRGLNVHWGDMYRSVETQTGGLGSKTERQAPAFVDNRRFPNQWSEGLNDRSRNVGARRIADSSRGVGGTQYATTTRNGNH